MSFVENYLQILKNGYDKVVYTHDTIQKTYEYKGFTHCNTETWKEEFVNLILTNLLNYCYETKEIEQLYSPNIPDIQPYLRKATRDRLNAKTNSPQQDGLCGELLIDLILRMENTNNKTLICRPKYQQIGSKAELKNYDVLMFNEEDSTIKLILGQVKSGGYDYCKEDMKKDLNTKYNSTYFGNAVCYIADRLLCDTPSKTLFNILNDINEISLATDNKNIRNEKICEYIKSNNIQVEIPCLLLYTNGPMYKDDESIKKEITTELKKIEDYFDSKSFSIRNFNYSIIFYVFPAKDVSELRNSIMNYKQEVIDG